MIAYDPAVLREVLEELHRELGPGQPTRATPGSATSATTCCLALVDRGRTFAHRHDGYWRDLGQPHHYLRAHHEVLTDDRGVLSVPGWPVLSRLPQRVPARVLDGGVVGRLPALAGLPGLRHRAHAACSAPGVVVEAGAEVHDSVVFADTVVRGGRRRALVGRGRRTASSRRTHRLGTPDAAALDDPDAVTLVGRGSRVSGAHPAGSRLEPGTAG